MIACDNCEFRLLALTSRGCPCISTGHFVISDACGVGCYCYCPKIESVGLYFNGEVPSKRQIRQAFMKKISGHTRETLRKQEIERVFGSYKENNGSVV